MRLQIYAFTASAARHIAAIGANDFSPDFIQSNIHGKLTITTRLPQAKRQTFAPSAVFNFGIGGAAARQIEMLNRQKPAAESIAAGNKNFLKKSDKSN